MGFGSTRRLADGTGYRNTLRGGVEIRISMKEVEKRMRRMKDKLPKLRERAFKTQMKTILGQLRKAMAKGGGLYGVPKFPEYEQFTKDLKSFYGKDPSGPIGGWLASKTAFRYEALTPFTSERPKVRMGWLDSAADLATRFQLGEPSGSDPFQSANQRHYWHRILATSDLPSAYVRNVRQVIVPFEVHVRENLQKWIEGYVRKTLAHQIAKEMRGGMAA